MGMSPLRSIVTVSVVSVVLVPYLVGLGLVEGLRQEISLTANRSMSGRLPDLYVSGSRFGRRVPVPVSVAETIAGFDGVSRVIPRIVGRVRIGQSSTEAIVVGIPASEWSRHAPSHSNGWELIEGDWPASERGEPAQLLVGSALATRLQIEVGDVLPPLVRTRHGDKTPLVVGVFRSDGSLWQSQMILTTWSTATELFDQPGMVTDLLVTCRAGQAEAIRSRILREVVVSAGESMVQPVVMSRSDFESLLPAGLGHRGGVFSMLFVMALSMGVLVVLLTSGLGLRDRRRTIGILKATGWQTDQVLLRGLVEHLILAVIAASASVLIAYCWLEVFNGYLIASVFLAGLEAEPGVTVPFSLAPVPVVLAFLISCAVVMTGNTVVTWRVAVAPPAEAMR